MTGRPDGSGPGARHGPLRVLLVNGNFEDGTVGGTQTFTRNLAHALAEAGHEVAVLCQGDDDHQERVGPVRVFRVRPPVLRFGGDRYWAHLVNQTLAIQNPAVAPKVAAVLRGFRPQVCHVQMLRRLTPTVLAEVRRHPRVAVVQTVHEPFSLWNFNAYQREETPDKLYTRRPAAVTVLKRHHRRLSATVDHLCAPSATALSPYLADGYFTGVPRTIIPNTVPFEWGNPLHAARRRRQADAREDVTRFLFVGRLDHYKGVRPLLAAFEALDVPSARLDVAGEGILAAEVAEHARRDPRTTFHGPVEGERRRDLFDRADVLLCPSTWDEPFGLVVLEAYAAGLPVVVARSGALPELVDDGGTGLVVAPGSAGALTAAMRRVLDPADRHRMAANAANRAWTYRPDRFLTDQLTVYHRALAARPRNGTRT
ncbi:glycosyltransferase [Actinosynnema sp. NPDC050801]|uniref:glycosyltransferase n=1 Tax=unclassified Actinosynnema TaxID=2637065 RepID=UPI003409B017